MSQETFLPPPLPLLVSLLNTQLPRKAFRAEDNEIFQNEKFGREIEWRESWAIEATKEAAGTSRAQGFSGSEVRGAAVSHSSTQGWPGRGPLGLLYSFPTEFKKQKGSCLVTSLSSRTRRGGGAPAQESRDTVPRRGLLRAAPSVPVLSILPDFDVLNKYLSTWLIPRDAFILSTSSLTVHILRIYLYYT